MMLYDTSGAIIAMIVGAVLGSGIADWDQRKFVARLLKIKHRSFLTHSPVLPVILSTIATFSDNVPFYATVGLCIGYAVHLVFDLFPKSWHGIAKISLAPLSSQRLSRNYSFLWIGASVVIALYLSMAQLQSVFDWSIAGVAVVLSFGWYQRNEPRFILPVIGLWVCFSLALVFYALLFLI